MTSTDPSSPPPSLLDAPIASPLGKALIGLAPEDDLDSVKDVVGSVTAAIEICDVRADDYTPLPATPIDRPRPKSSIQRRSNDQQNAND